MCAPLSVIASLVESYPVHVPNMGNPVYKNRWEKRCGKFV